MKWAGTKRFIVCFKFQAPDAYQMYFERASWALVALDAGAEVQNDRSASSQRNHCQLYRRMPQGSSSQD
jgi:hypothetical protein